MKLYTKLFASILTILIFNSCEDPNLNDLVIQEESELSDIIESYKIEEEIVPRMRMKWKSGHDKVEEKDISTIGTNNIHLLSYAIP